MSWVTVMALLIAGISAGCTQAQITPIGTVQGRGDESSLSGQVVTVRGVVTADLQGPNRLGLGGFFVQSADVDADEDPLTSEGLWVFQGDDGVDVRRGDVVRVSGEVTEFEGLTELNVTGSSGEVVVEGVAPLPASEPLALGEASVEVYETLEGMRVELLGEPVITDVGDLDRFGSLRVAADRRLVQFTECERPDEAALAVYDSLQAARSLIIDDGRGGQNLAPEIAGIALDAASGVLRAGNSLPRLTGVLDERFGGYRVQASEFPRITMTNPRPTGPPGVGGELRVASLNVLNYFDGDGQGGGFPTERGARSHADFLRQQAKLVSALCALEADVVGLIEIENDGYGPGSSLGTLAAAVREACGVDYLAVEPTDIGDDQIRVALLYRPDRIELAGQVASLTSPGNLFSRNRVPLAASFAQGSELFTVVVNHLKSKGGSCDDSGISDDDSRAGAGACDGTRTAAATAIVDWLATDPTGVNDQDFLVIGDLNAYRRERPIETFNEADYVDLVDRISEPSAFACGGSASFVFRGAWGTLDYALASSPLAAQVTGAAIWHVNAAEPDALAYYQAGSSAEDYYRFSDHDPVLVGISLGSTSGTRTGAAGEIDSQSPGRVAPLGGRRYRLLNPPPPGAKLSLVDTAGRAHPLQLGGEGDFELPGSLPSGAYALSLRGNAGQLASHWLIVR